KLGTPGSKKNKNPFLDSDGNLNLVEKFPGIDFMIYEKKRLKNRKQRGD
ncbi:unnamed protein product, partial [marine sediment metagenome]